MKNREILFRGLKADGSNEWVYGYYRKWFNSFDGKEVHIISNDYGEGNLVISETVEIKTDIGEYKKIKEVKIG